MNASIFIDPFDYKIPFNLLGKYLGIVLDSFIKIDGSPEIFVFFLVS